MDLSKSNSSASSVKGQPSASNPSHHHSSHHHHHGSSHQTQQLQIPHQVESKLYSMISIEQKDPLENVLEESFNKLQHMISNTNSSMSAQTENVQSLNELSQHANQSRAHYDEVCNALLYSILTDPANSSKCLRNLFLCNSLAFNLGGSVGLNSTDSSSVSPSSYGVLINNLLNITTENYNRLLDIPRQQLIWLLKELVKAKINQFDKLLLQMLRNIQSGSLNDKNIWLAESMLDILYEQQTPTIQTGSSSSDSTGSGSFQTLWLYSVNELMLQSVYTYLRLISDHAQNPSLTQLRQRETEFCIQVLRERWNDCIMIGRDLVRLLQNLSKIPEFELLWKDIINSPQTLSPQFGQHGGLNYLMRLPTRRRCLISRLTVEMERKIYFIITSVKAGQQKRYQEWFQRQYLNTAESQSLRVDIIRYITVVVHPTNEQLNAGLTPRWALCGWLLNTCTSLVDLANLKLALFFDWLFYDAKKDNIMLIEPAVLLMFNSTRANNLNNTCPLTSSLFDFLCRISTNYFWPLKDQILVGLMQSFKDAIDKRVIPSMQVFFTNQTDVGSKPGQQPQPTAPFLDRDLKNLIQSTFGNFFQTLNISQAPMLQPQASQQSVTQIVKPVLTKTPGQEDIQSTMSTLNQSNQPQLQTTISFGSNSSLFKQKSSSIHSDESSSGFGSNSENSSPAPSPASMSSNTASFSSLFPHARQEQQIEQLKSEPVSFMGDSDNIKIESAFSSDDDDSNQEIKPAIQNSASINQFLGVSQVTNLTTPSPSSMVQLQQQLNQFITRPFKIFAAPDDLNQNLDNHLNLIPSDDLRDKLVDLNEKIKDLNGNQVKTNNMQSVNMFKDILNFIHRDAEMLNNFSTSATDLAVSICLILKNDFTNNLLPSSFYNSNSNSLKQSSSNITALMNDNDVDLISGIFTSSNSSLFLSQINDSIQQRPIFALFKELAFTTNQSNEREILMQLLHEIYLKQNRVGYYFLYYMNSLHLKSQNSMTSNAGSSTNIASSSSGGSATNSSTELTNLLRIYREFILERYQSYRSDNKEDKSLPTTFNLKVSSDSDVSDEELSNIKNKNKSNSNYEPITSSSSSNESDGDEDEDNEESDDESNSENEEEKFSENDLILGQCIMQDLRLCQQDDPHLFLFLFPFILSNQDLIPNYMINNSELMYLICSCIGDSKQLKDIVAAIISQDIYLLKQPEPKKDVKGSSRKQAASKRSTKNSAKANKGTASSTSGAQNNKKRKRTNSTTKSKSKKQSKLKKNKQSQKGTLSSTFKKENLMDVLNTSLQWETIEQIFFWELLVAHDLELENLLPLFNKLDSNRNSEAICYFFQLLKTSDPTFDLVKCIVQRRVDDNITRALFIHWTRSSGEVKMAQLFTKLLNKSAPNAQQQTTLKKIKYNESLSSNKKLTAEQQLEMIANQKKAAAGQGSSNNGGSKSTNKFDLNDQEKDNIPSLDQVLGHLNRLRLNTNCVSFILKENLLETLKKVYKKYCDDELKKKYSDLFALANDSNSKSDSEIEDINSDDDIADKNEEQTNNNEDEEDDEEDENSDSESENSENSNGSIELKRKKKHGTGKSKTPTKTKTAANKNKGKQAGSKKPKTKSNNSSDSEVYTKTGKPKNKANKPNQDKGDYDSMSDSDSSDYSSRNKKSKQKSKSGSNSKLNKSGGDQSGSNQPPPRKKLKQQDNSDDGSD